MAAMARQQDRKHSQSRVVNGKGQQERLLICGRRYDRMVTAVRQWRANRFFWQRWRDDIPVRAGTDTCGNEAAECGAENLRDGDRVLPLARWCRMAGGAGRCHAGWKDRFLRRRTHRLASGTTAGDSAG